MVVSNIAFNDDVINATQLTRNWGHWAARARNHPVTILYKDDPITLVSRRHISEMSQRLHYTYLVFSVCQYIEGRTNSCDVLPWVTYLNNDLRQEFLRYILDAYMDSNAKSSWNIIQDAIDDWAATAEVASNPKLSKRLMEKDDPLKYVPIKG